MNPKLLSALCAMAGSVAPDIMVLYSKRFTMPQVTFTSSQYIMATGLYILLAAVVGLIFPYKAIFKTDANLTWKSFCIGVSLPIVISTVAALTKSQLIAPRGGTISGNLHDLISLF